jgi:hypothetical protein
MNWKTTGIGAAIGGGSGLLIGGMVGGPVGAVGGLVAGGLIGGGVGALMGKKSPNPGPPLTIDGKPVPDDLYDILGALYRSEEDYLYYFQEEALPPEFIFPREAGWYIIQRYSRGVNKSKYQARGSLLSVDLNCLIAEQLPEYRAKLKYLYALPLTVLAVESVLEHHASDDQIRYALGVLKSKLGPVPKLYGEGLYRQLEYYIVVAIADSIKKYQPDPSQELSYRTILSAILYNHHANFYDYLENTCDETFLDSTMMEHFRLSAEEKEKITSFRSEAKIVTMFGENKMQVEGSQRPTTLEEKYS